mgnify:CR=1 FL=1
MSAYLVSGKTDGMSFLKKYFGDVATFKWPSSPGLFDIADNKFKKDKSYRDYAEVLRQAGYSDEEINYILKEILIR